MDAPVRWQDVVAMMLSRRHADVCHWNVPIEPAPHQHISALVWFRLPLTVVFDDDADLMWLHRPVSR